MTITTDEALKALTERLVESGDFGAGDAGHVAIATLRVAINVLCDALDSTTWSSGCWCSGKDRRGHSATCEARRAAIRQTGRTPPGKDM